MKRSIVISVLVLIMLTGFASAQTTLSGKPTNTDGTIFTVTITKEKDDMQGGRTLATKILTVGGKGSHIDAIYAGDSLSSIEFYLFTQGQSETAPSLKHILSCSGNDFVGISSKPDDPLPATYSRSMKGVALCSFNPDGIGTDSDGVGYLMMTATERMTDTGGNLSTKMYVSSATVGGGIFVDFGSRLVFKGTLTATLLPIP